MYLIIRLIIKIGFFENFYLLNIFFFCNDDVSINLVYYI